MPRNESIKKVLVLGSGPIVIGQAAEFDYAGTQACLALKEEGYEVVLCNSNPATIMTDTTIADKVYMEPLTLEYMAKILRYERPDAIVPGIGGQTGLNLAMQLEKKGVLKECRVELLSTNPRRRFNIPLTGEDYCVWDLNAKYSIDPAAFRSMGRATPFAGMEVFGRCVKTVYNGKTVYIEK